jgi:uncharacterized membrane protein YkvA (DUF1232 family)
MTEQATQSTQSPQVAPPISEQPTSPILIEVPAPDSNPVMERFWAAVKRIPRYIFLGTHLVRDDRVPNKVKAMIAVGGAYVISPIDLVPGIIPVAGQLDDLVVLLMTLRHALKSCPPDVAEENLKRAGLTVDDFDTDLKAVKDTAVWLAQKGIQATSRVAARSGRRIRQLLGIR